MEVPARVRVEAVKRFQATLADKKRETELEARVSTPIERSDFERAMRYCSAVMRQHRPPEDSLDISQEQGSYRATVSDLAEIGRLCMPGTQPSDIGEGASLIRKELLAPRLDLAEYGITITLKRETPLPDTERDTALRSLFTVRRMQSYRLKRRRSFFSHDGDFSIDLTAVKQKVGASAAALFGVAERYEVEVELLPGSDRSATELCDALLRNVAELLLVMGGKREGSILKASERAHALAAYDRITAVPQNVVNRFVGPQPVSLERSHLFPGTDGHFDILSNYTVTEKADGQRAMLFLDEAGRGYLIDMQMRPSTTDVLAPSIRNTLLDGELVTHSRSGAPINTFLVFDAYFLNGRDVRTLPLTLLAAPAAPTDRGVATRLEAAQAAAAALAAATNPRVQVKRFLPRQEAARIYAEVERGAFDYDVDGVILTPADLSVFQTHAGAPISRRTGTWQRAFKWKPARENSVDFKVVFDKTSRGDLVVSRGRLHARLLVGRQGVGPGGVVDAYSVLTGTFNAQSYELVEFDPPEYGLGNAMGWSPPADLADKALLPACLNPPFEQVRDEAIVEFSWDTESRSWQPLRIRHDKIRPNALRVAESVWRSIAFPVTIEDIVDPARVTDPGPSATDDIYYARETAGDGSASQPMRKFHGYWIKNRTLIANAARFAARAGEPLSLMDIAVGEAGDLRWWLDARFDIVVGVDSAEPNILGADTGAYARLAEAKLGRARRPVRYAFTVMRGDEPIGAAAVHRVRDEGLRRISETLWAVPGRPADPKLKPYHGLADRQFDVVSVQFAIHYFFGSATALDQLISNIDTYLRPGGVLIGTCMDGRAVDDAFAAAGGDTVQGTGADGAVLWRIQKRYPGRLAEDGSEANLGRQVDVYVDTINKVTPEFLVDFELLTARLRARGIAPLDKKAAARFGTASSSELFGTTFAATDWDAKRASRDQREAYAARLASAMTPASRTFSFLNRWFVYAKASK